MRIKHENWDETRIKQRRLGEKHKSLIDLRRNIDDKCQVAIALILDQDFAGNGPFKFEKKIVANPQAIKRVLTHIII